jgi:hypothetical protein
MDMITSLKQVSCRRHFSFFFSPESADISSSIDAGYELHQSGRFNNPQIGIWTDISLIGHAIF